MRQGNGLPFEANLVDVVIFLLDCVAAGAAKVVYGAQRSLYRIQLRRAEWRARHGGA